MSRVSVKHGTATGFQDTLQKLADAAPRLMSMSAESGRTFAREATSFAREAANLLSSSLPKIEIARPRMMPLCDIPETECPPRCVCEIEWHACRGEKLQATISVKNTSKTARLFQFTAAPIMGPGSPAVPIQLSPANANLSPNQSVIVTATLTANDQFQHGQTYTSEVLINGAYEQCVRIIIHVDPEETPHCEVEQGEIPTRIRAHRWYDHFQCEEPCEEPRHTHPGTTVPNPTGEPQTPGAPNPQDNT